MMTQQEPTHGPWVGAGAVLLVLLIGTGMFYYQFYYLPAAIGPPHVPQNVDIYITAVQWAFMINGTIDTHTTPVIVHVGDNVTFHLNATFLQDHSFSEHGFFIQGIMDTPVAIPAGQQVIVKIVPTQPGDYTIICTIFCGTGHADMHGMLEVLP